jgi:CspA family cold shock protein
MPSGVVKFYDDRCGFGFIQQTDGRRDVFVHITALERAGMGILKQGQRLDFYLEEDKRGRGPKAVNLALVT